MELLKKTLEDNKNYYIEKLRELISIDTQVIGHGIDGGKEKKGQEYLENLLIQMEADSIEKDQLREETMIASLKKHDEGNLGHDYEGRYNLLAEFKGENSSKKLVFNGHVDTMPPGKMELWKTDPWTPIIKDNRIYGLGAADMKSGLMASLMAVKLIKDAGLKLPIDVTFTSVVDEEGGGNGSISLVNRGITGDGVVVCEPSENNIKAAHMGFVFFNIKVKGKALHSGSKWLGINAIEKMMFLIDGLIELEHNWLMRYKHDLLPPPTLNVGVIKGGSAGSTVPDNCEINICVHYLPEIMSKEQVVKDIEDSIYRRSQGDFWLKDNLPKISIYQAGGSFETDRNSYFFKKSKELINTVIEDSEIVGSPAGNDARLFQNISKIPTIIAGPGNMAQCHSPNEYVEIDEYLNFILFYALLILNF